MSDLTDINIIMDNLDSKLFPGVPSSVEVHDGFRNEHELTASTILAEVKRLMASKNTQSVTVVRNVKLNFYFKFDPNPQIGHSLGGALAELDALFFTLNLPSSTSIQAVTYGTPRVGNPAFAQFFDSKVQNDTRCSSSARSMY